MKINLFQSCVLMQVSAIWEFKREIIFLSSLERQDQLSYFKLKREHKSQVYICILKRQNVGITIGFSGRPRGSGKRDRARHTRAQNHWQFSSSFEFFFYNFILKKKSSILFYFLTSIYSSLEFIYFFLFSS